jgi:hypothetical protein
VTGVGQRQGLGDPARPRVGFLGVGWLRKNQDVRPARQEAVHQHSGHPLYLDGASWKAYTERYGSAMAGS